MTSTQAVSSVRSGPVTVITLHRPQARNAVDGPTAQALVEAFEAFESDESASVAVLHGGGGTFCSGADLKAIGTERSNQLQPDGPGPMGPTRMRLAKPVIAAVEGHAVAGGLELALWCDLRIAASDAVFGVYCRRWGVPLIDGGTVRLQQIIGTGRALDMILTGRAVDASEAQQIGLTTRLVKPGEALDAAVELGLTLARLPQVCMRHDRLSVLEATDLPEADALANEFRHGLHALRAGETIEGAARFAAGAGRHGQQEPTP